MAITDRMAAWRRERRVLRAAWRPAAASALHHALAGTRRPAAIAMLGEAIAMYGRIFKSLHVLAFYDDEAYRREIKAGLLRRGRQSTRT